MKGRQKGMVVMGTVIILLALMTFITTNTLHSLHRLYLTEQASNSSDIARITLEEAMHHAIDMLFTQPEEDRKWNNRDVALQIESIDLVGSQQQSLQQIAVSLSTKAPELHYSAYFLKYPALLRLPAEQHTRSPQKDITKWLFNRHINELYPNYFPNISIVSNCETLSGLAVIWVKGDCIINNNVKDNNAITPSLLIIEDGDLLLSAQTTFFGVVLQINNTTKTYRIYINNNDSVVGAVVSNTQITTQILGEFTYSDDVLLALQARPELQKLIAIPGSRTIE